MVSWSICARCLVKFRKSLSPRESFPTSPQMGRIDRDPRSRGARHVGRSVSQAPEKKSPKGTAGMADCDGCLLWPEPASSDKGRCRHRAIRECRGGRALRTWIVDRGDIRADPSIAREILEFIEEHRVRSVAITDGIIGCPHPQGIDYEGEWCPVCEFWHGRDRFAGQRVH